MKIRMGFVSNSSSSSFICDTTMSLEEVRSKLDCLLNFYNEFFNRELTFDDVFSDPFIAGDDYVNSDWAEHYPQIKHARGKVIIESNGDNTIPYELFDFIEAGFDAHRCHFG